MINMKKWIVLYWKERWKLFGYLFGFFFCFSLIFILSRHPLEPVLYGFLLWFYISIILIIIDFVRFKGRCERLEGLKSQISFDIGNLPNPVSLYEKQYQELIRILYKNKMDILIQAEEKEKDRVDYITQWTHQIKTPISAMRLLLQAGNWEEKQDLEMELVKIEKYVESVLQYVRIDHMSNDIVLQRHPLDEIIKKAIRKNAKIFIHQKIHLDFRETGITVLTDAKWLLFVIEQILSNALKYTKEGTISIYLEGAPEDKRFVIRDTGIGISEEDLPRVFEKGFTGANGRLYSQSTGMGLYLAKQVMDKLSHRLSIQSKLGQGTKVIFDLKTEDILNE